MAEDTPKEYSLTDNSSTVTSPPRRGRGRPRLNKKKKSFITNQPPRDLRRGATAPPTPDLPPATLSEEEKLRRKEKSDNTRRQRLVLKAFFENPLLWGMHYCEEHFRQDFAPMHLKIIREACKQRYFAVAAPRESAKSTMLAFLYPIHAIYFQKKKFIIIVSNTYKKACTSLDNIKKELKENQKLKKDLNISIPRDAEGDSIIRHNVGFETRILCKGVDQIGSIRGEIFGAYRPDLLIMDDIEDDELVKNPERRVDLKNVIDEALFPALDKQFGQILVIGTILHDDSQMAKFVSLHHYKDFRKLLFRALYYIDNKYESLWPEKWSVDELLKKQKDMPGVFAKEYQNDPVAGPRAVFKRENFRIWSLENQKYILYGENSQVISKGNLCDCKAAIACDLAWDEKRENDFSVIMPAYLTPQSEILVDTYICEKGLRPDKIEEILFTMEERLRKITGSSVPIGFEKAKLEKVMKWLLSEAMKRRNRYLWFKELLWDGDKITRIETRLQARYVQHAIFHRTGMGDLEQQLVRFPSGVHDDLADALQGLCQLLNYPKLAKKEEVGTDEFEWWKSQAQKYHKPERLRYIFGNKNKYHSIPSMIGYR